MSSSHTGRITGNDREISVWVTDDLPAGVTQSPSFRPSPTSLVLTGSVEPKYIRVFDGKNVTFYRAEEIKIDAPYVSSTADCRFSSNVVTDNCVTSRWDSEINGETYNITHYAPKPREAHLRHCLSSMTLASRPPTDGPFQRALGRMVIAPDCETVEIDAIRRKLAIHALFDLIGCSMYFAALDLIHTEIGFGSGTSWFSDGSMLHISHAPRRE